jgi:type IV pilus assembly protein PilE
MKRTESGITLIELMTVMVIVGILASVALPAYTQYVRRSDRAQAKTALLENAQFLERTYTVTNSYALTTGGDPMTAETLFVTQSPKQPESAKYTIALDDEDLTATTFTLHAIPVAGTPATEDKCGTLTLTHTGAKSASGGSAANCWSK